jgi:hypothetical protein
MFTVIWLILLTVGLLVDMQILRTFVFDTQTLSIGYKICRISSYTSSIVAVVWVSVIERRNFLEILEHISEVDNKIRYTLQEETYMNRKVMFNIIPENIVLTATHGPVIIYNINLFASEPYYILIIQTISFVPAICNAIILFQFVILVFMMKQRFSHLNKRLTNWISGAVIRPIYSKKGNVMCNQSVRAVVQVNIARLFVSNVRNIEGTLRQTDIHWLQQIHSEMYDITCLINDTYGVPILATTCWILTGFIFSTYEALNNINETSFEDIACVVVYMVLFFKVIFFCHTATNEAMSSRTVVGKLLLEENSRKECVKQLKIFSLQLQAMKNEYTASGFFSLNLSLFTSVVSVIVSYVVVLVQIK